MQDIHSWCCKELKIIKRWKLLSWVREYKNCMTGRDKRSVLIKKFCETYQREDNGVDLMIVATTLDFDCILLGFRCQNNWRSMCFYLIIFYRIFDDLPKYNSIPNISH